MPVPDDQLADQVTLDTATMEPSDMPDEGQVQDTVVPQDIPDDDLGGVPEKRTMEIPPELEDMYDHVGAQGLVQIIKNQAIRMKEEYEQRAHQQYEEEQKKIQEQENERMAAAYREYDQTMNDLIRRLGPNADTPQGRDILARADFNLRNGLMVRSLLPDIQQAIQEGISGYHGQQVAKERAMHENPDLIDVWSLIEDKVNQGYDASRVIPIYKDIIGTLKKAGFKKDGSTDEPVEAMPGFNPIQSRTIQDHLRIVGDNVAGRGSGVSNKSDMQKFNKANANAFDHFWGPKKQGKGDW